ncbi:MAG: nucleotidyltransferase domain-containing protein [Spirochaetaceae bacterium]|nr:nucleotidyltransferase domain-containing protein [Spirochaetaceae bacterium]
MKNQKNHLKNIIYMEVTNIPQKYQNDVEVAVNYLKSEGCSAIYLFGSIVTGRTHDDSDIDIGVKGLLPKKFIRTYSILNRVVRKLQVSEQLPLENAKCVAFCKTWATTNRVGEQVQ